MLYSSVLFVLIIFTSSLPVFAQGPAFADIESEIDALQWGVVLHLKEDNANFLRALRLVILLEVADKFVERAMVEYAEGGQVTESVEKSLHRAVYLLERMELFTEEGDFIINNDMDRAVDIEMCREQKLNDRGRLSVGDEPWTGESIAAYSYCTMVNCYIDVLISRINLWMAG